jgi:parvulin-like peptidyl-prolyl isomerase
MERMRIIFSGLLPLFIVFLNCAGPEEKTDEARFFDDRVIVKTGDHIFTLGEMNRKYKNVEFESLQDEYEKKKRHAELTLERFLHIDAARIAGLSYELDSAAVQGYLAQELYKRDADINIDISDSDVRAYFEKYGGEIQFGPLIVKEQALIDSIYGLLENGADWDSLVLEHSILGPGKKRGGSLGYVPFGQYGEEIQGKAYDLDIGEYTEPFRLEPGWCIVKLFDRIKHSQKDLEREWDGYKKVASNYSQILQTDNYKNSLLNDYDYRINWNIIDTMIYISDSVRNAGSLPDDMPGSAYLQKSAFNEQLLDSKMVEFKNGGFTISEYIDLMDTYNPYKSPDLDERFALELILKDLSTKKVMVVRARELGYDTLQPYLDALQYHEENWLIQEFNKKLLAAIDSVTDEDIRKYYDEHPDDFFRPEQVRVSAISLKTEEEALRVLDKLNMGANFAAMAAKYSTDKKSASEWGDLNFFTEKRYTEIFDAARGKDIGEIGGPVRMYGNYWVFQVTQRLSRERRPVELARSNISSKIYADRRIQAVRSWVRENKENAEYFLDLDLLRSDLGIELDDTPQSVVEEEG